MSNRYIQTVEKYVKICLNISKPDEIKQNIWNFVNYVQKRPKLQNCPKMYKKSKFVKINQNVSKHDEIKQKNHFVSRQHSKS